MAEIENIGTGRHAARMASALFAGRIVSILLAGVSLIVVARILGPCYYGIYALSLAVVGIFGAFGDFGISSTINRFVPEYLSQNKRVRINELLSNSFAILAVLGIVATGAAMLLGTALSGFFLHNSSACSGSYAPAVLVAALTLFLGVIFATAANALVGFGMGKQTVVVVIAQASVQAAASMALALLGLYALAPLLGMVAGFAVGAAASFYIILKRIGVRLASPTLAGVKRVLGFSVPISLYNLSGVGPSVGTMLLGLFAGAVAVGYFGIAIRVLTLITSFTGAIGVALLPTFASMVNVNAARARSRNIGSIYGNAIYYTLLVLLPLIIFVAVLAGPLAITVFGGAYAEAAPLVAIMALGSVLALAGSYAALLLISKNMVRAVAVLGLITLAATVAPAPIAIMLAGGMGLAILLFVAGPAMGAALLVHALSGRLGARPHMGKTWRLIAAGGLSALLILPLYALLAREYIPLLIAALVEQLALYPVLLALTGAAGKRELEKVCGIFSGVAFVGAVVRAVAAYTMVFVRMRRG